MIILAQVTLMRDPIISMAYARELSFKAYVRGSDAANLAGDCEDPFTVTMRGQGPLIFNQLKTINEDPFVDWYQDRAGSLQWVPGREADAALPPTVLTVHVKVRCRKCFPCLRAKERLWMARSIHEVRSASRTWFGTLTVGPDRRFWAKCKATNTVLQRRCEAFEKLSPRERTRALDAEISPEITRWLKRVRKASSAPLRYLLVCEPHKDGFPHYHLLLHELGQPVGKRTLQEKWGWGFSRFTLVESGSVREAMYACKYLTKSPQTRIRASRRYGQAQSDVGARAREERSAT